MVKEGYQVGGIIDSSDVFMKKVSESLCEIQDFLFGCAWPPVIKKSRFLK